MRKSLCGFWAAMICGAVVFGQGDCMITNLTATPHSCENGMFLVDIDFDIVNPGGEIFGIVGNATNYGYFSLDSLPVTLGPLPGDGVTNWTFIVYVLANPNCQDAIVLGTYDCCTLSNVSVTPVECQNQNFFSVIVNLDTANTGGVGFDVFSATGTPLGFFLYADLPVLVTNIPYVGIGNTSITVCDQGNNLCCTTATFPALDCNPNDCEIYNLSVTASECAAGQFYAILNFSYQNVSPMFTVMGNGVNYGSYAYADLPVAVGPLMGDGATVYEFVVKDAVLTAPGCIDAFVLGIVECPPACGFLDIAVEPVVCQSDSTYAVFIAFEPIATGEEGFSVYKGDELLGTFDYTDLPVILDNFPASGDFFDTLVICDNLDITCCSIIEFHALLCGECIIYNVSATPSQCDSNGQFFVEINFQYQNASMEGFQIGGNGNDYGTFLYSELPVTLGPFDGDGFTYYEFAVFDLGGGFCISGTELGIIDCNCAFDSLTLTPLQCSSFETYSLEIDFVPVSPVHEHFDVYAGDTYLGTFPYVALPVVITHFPWSGNDYDVITICDQDNPTCCLTTEFMGIDCTPICEILQITAEAFPCDSGEVVFNVYLDIEWDGDIETFEVYHADELVGTIHTADLPDSSIELVHTGHEVFALTICAAGFPHCCETVEFMTPDCGVELCEIHEIAVETGECTSDSTFFVVIEFAYAGFTNDFVEMWTGDYYLGLFHRDSQPVVIDDFPWRGTQFQPLRICQNDDPDCCHIIEFEAPDCSVEVCEIVHIVAEAFGYCNPDSLTFPVFLNLEWHGDITAFDVFAGDQLIKVVQADDLPDTIVTFPLPAGELAEITVCASGNPACCASRTFVAPDCEEPDCAIVDVVVETAQCTSDSTYSAWVHYAPVGFDGPVEVWANENYLGVFPPIIPLLLSNVPVVSGNSVVRICQVENPECCREIEFEGLQCGPPPVCTIAGLTAVTSECDSNNMFTITVDFTPHHTGDNFTLFGNGNFYGTFEYEEVPITLGPFEEDVTRQWEFAVLDQTHPGCFGFYVLGTVLCTPDTVSTQDLSKFVSPLEIFYSAAGEVWCVVPKDTESLVIWTVDGRRLATFQDLVPGQHFQLNRHIPVAGFYIIQALSAHRSYVGKVVVH